MSDTKITSVTVEVQHRDGSATLVIREPRGADRRVYVAGDLPPEAVDEVLLELGLQQSAPSSSRVGAPPPSTRLPSAPLTLSSTELANLPDPSSATSLPDLLQELTSAVLRTGRNHPTSTVDELLERAWAAAPGNAPLARVLARLEEGLEAKAPPPLAALALAALGELEAAMRAPSSPPLERLHLELLGKTEALEPCSLIEIGRRRERSAVRWETRLLLETSTGALFREEAALNDKRLSRGTVGRTLSVTLARAAAGVHPMRLHIQQYEYEPAPSQEQLDRIASWAAPHLPEISESGLELLLVPRPALLSVEDVRLNQSRCVLSTGQTDLLLSDGECSGATSALFEYQREARVHAVAGSLELAAHGHGTELVFVPWAALLQTDGGSWRLLALGT